MGLPVPGLFCDLLRLPVACCDLPGPLLLDFAMELRVLRPAIVLKADGSGRKPESRSRDSTVC